jgi:hypothetical protein
MYKVPNTLVEDSRFWQAYSPIEAVWDIVGGTAKCAGDISEQLSFKEDGRTVEWKVLYSYICEDQKELAVLQRLAQCRSIVSKGSPQKPMHIREILMYALQIDEVTAETLIIEFILSHAPALHPFYAG